MTRPNINDGTDAFDVRLPALQRLGVPSAEAEAAIKVYERVRTAKSICQALLPEGFGEASVVALAEEIGREVHRSQGTRSEL